MPDSPDRPQPGIAAPSQGPPVELGELSRRFGLGALRTVSYHHGATGAWQLTDGLDAYSLKLTAADVPAWALDGLQSSGEFEWEVYQAGVSMPEPLHPLEPGRGLAALVRDQYAVMHRWVEKVRPCRDNERIGDWLGGTLATLHRVAPAVRDADLTNQYGLHPLSEWRRWALDAEAAGLPWSAAATDGLRLVAELRPLLSEAVERWAHTARLVHSDISPANVLISPRGPLLCDFDARADMPWMEAVGVAAGFGDPDPSVLASYLAAGGPPAR